MKARIPDRSSASGFGQVALLWPSLRREGFRYATVFDPRVDELANLMALLKAQVLGHSETPAETDSYPGP